MGALKKIKTDSEVMGMKLKTETVMSSHPVSKDTDTDSLSNTTDDVASDTPDAELPSCQVMKAASTISPTLEKTRTSHSAASSPSPNQCQFGSSKQFSQCMGADQVYYPHHSSRMANSSFLPVSTSALLQPVSSGLSQMQQACRLPGQSNDCSLRQSAGLATSHGYGIRTPPNQHHPSLSSCTYMQSAQQYAHLAPNMHMMNMNFPGPMA